MKYILIFLLMFNFLYSSLEDNNKTKKDIVIGISDQIVIGVRAYQGKKRALKEWEATIDYLNEKVKGYHFKLLPLVDYEEIMEIIRDKKIDFLIADPVMYVEAEYLYGVTRLATLQREKDGFYFDKFGSVIFTRADSNINTLKDLKDKTFLAVSPNAFAGLRVAFREIMDNGINPQKYLKEISYTDGRGDLVLKGILEKKADVGTMRTGILEFMIETGKVKKEDIKVINQKNYEYFPFAVSTKLYPEFPFARLSHIPEDLGKKVLIALLSINENSPAAKNGRYARWLIPNEYTDVVNLMKDLNVGVYKDFGKITFKKVLKEYWIQIGLTIIFIMILLYLIIKIKKQAIELEILSTIDNLTKLYNRLKTNQVMQEEFEKAKKYMKSFGIILLDIDLFKKINDNYGHQAGDRVLISVSNILKNSANRNFVVGRWGGEEFLIICKDTNIDEIITLAKSIKDIIENTNHYKELKVTSSFGVTKFEEDDFNYDDMLARADKALYKAEKNGRNRVEIL